MATVRNFIAAATVVAAMTIAGVFAGAIVGGWWLGDAPGVVVAALTGLLGGL